MTESVRPETVAEFLRRIEPRRFDYRGRPKHVPQERLNNFAAIKEVLTTGGTVIDIRGLCFAVAKRHGADKWVVWRRVRRFRERSQEQARTPDPYRQLELPLPENSTEHVRRRGP